MTLSEDEILEIVRRAEACFAKNDGAELNRILAQISGAIQLDSRLMFLDAKSLFWFGDAEKAKSRFEELMAMFPDFRSPEGHLYYCQCLELTGETEKAIEEFARLAVYYPGAQAKVRYALLLAKAGHALRARAIATDVVQQASIANSAVQDSQEPWLQQAKSLILDLADKV